MIISNFPGGGGSAMPLPQFIYTGRCAVLRDEDGWKIRFLTSGTLTITSKDTDVDVFLVGGGGGGGAGSQSQSGWTGPGNSKNGSGGGGGGGYTNTVPKQMLKANSPYEVVIGAGGAGAVGVQTYVGATGGETSFNGHVAAGGEGGRSASYNTTTYPNANIHTGGAGGSGGGGGSNAVQKGNGGNGGSNGGNGSEGQFAVVGGTGQGTTTAEFGEEGGKLYAGGGGGGQSYYAPGIAHDWADAKGGEGGGGDGATGTTLAAEPGETNTGGGGGGGYCIWSNSASGGANGGSGIVIIRNARG